MRGCIPSNLERPGLTRPAGETPAPVKLTSCQHTHWTLTACQHKPEKLTQCARVDGRSLRRVDPPRRRLGFAGAYKLIGSLHWYWSATLKEGYHTHKTMQSPQGKTTGLPDRRRTGGGMHWSYWSHQYELPVPGSSLAVKGILCGGERPENRRCWFLMLRLHISVVNRGSSVFVWM